MFKSLSSPYKLTAIIKSLISLITGAIGIKFNTPPSTINLLCILTGSNTPGIAEEAFTAFHKSPF